MSDAFVIMAAGRGTRVGRVGENLHKALLPLGDRAVLSHLFKLAPRNARIIICIGDRGEQLRDYVALAHPNRTIQFIEVDDWDQPGSGPGASLLAARDAVGDDDLTFTSCDTLWDDNVSLWHSTYTSWVGVAAIPAGTEAERWCRFMLDHNNGDAVKVLDKEQSPEMPDRSACDTVAYVGLAHIIAPDLPTFWYGVEHGTERENELQVSGGFTRLIKEGYRLRTYDVVWTDTGDEVGYRRAVAQHTGYDWTKIDQATYVLKDEHRVVKYFADHNAVSNRWTRGVMLGTAVPRQIARRGDCMLAYQYIEGETVYDRIKHDPNPLDVTRGILDWRRMLLTEPALDHDGYELEIGYHEVVEATRHFYYTKTVQRIEQLKSRELYRQAMDVVGRIDWGALADGFQPGVIHGDLNFGNIIVQPDGTFIGIDWREDFNGHHWFDLRYDLGKLLAGTVVHWDNARRGDFRPWDEGAEHAIVIKTGIKREHSSVNSSAHVRDVEIIGALSLINSAPLHASPLDEILIARGTTWLERVL